jgi:predicted nucleic acid-binding protein
MATMQAAAELHVLDVERAVSLAWAYLRVQLVKEGRRANGNDLWIAATALSHDLPVITQDSDFAALDGVADLRVVVV